MNIYFNILACCGIMAKGQTSGLKGKKNMCSKSLSTEFALPFSSSFPLLSPVCAAARLTSECSDGLSQSELESKRQG